MVFWHTLLDEIEELSPKNQVKLLNSLEEKRFRRIGGLKDIESDLRVITSSNKDLPKEIKEKRFREDLFYRINALSINIPPLRERKEDILPLTHYFLKKEREEKRRDYFLTNKAKIS